MCRIVGAIGLAREPVPDLVEFREEFERKGHGSLLFGDRCRELPMSPWPVLSLVSFLQQSRLAA